VSVDGGHSVSARLVSPQDGRGAVQLQRPLPSGRHHPPVPRDLPPDDRSAENGRLRREERGRLRTGATPGDGRMHLRRRLDPISSESGHDA